MCSVSVHMCSFQLICHNTRSRFPSVCTPCRDCASYGSMLSPDMLWREGSLTPRLNQAKWTRESWNIEHAGLTTSDSFGSRAQGRLGLCSPFLLATQQLASPKSDFLLPALAGSSLYRRGFGQSLRAGISKSGRACRGRLRSGHRGRH